MKKSVFAVLVALTLCCLVVVSVTAIDTPWLPITPDGGNESESVSTDENTTEPTPSDPSNTEEPTQTGSGDGEEQDTPVTGTSSELQNGTNGTRPPESGSVTSSEQSDQTLQNSTPEQGSQASTSSEQTSDGCSTALNGCGWMFTAICGAWMLCRTKHAEEKEVIG